jgi:hypothetical protein
MYFEVTRGQRSYDKNSTVKKLLNSHQSSLLDEHSDMTKYKMWL